MMARVDMGSRIKEKLARKMAKLERKLADLPLVEDLELELGEIDTALEGLESEMDIDLDLDLEMVDEVPGLSDKLAAKLDRLMAKKERLELKRDLRAEKRERLEEALEELHNLYDQRASVSVTTSSPARSGKNLEEERRKILEMLQEGKINADEAAKLLEALRGQEDTSRSRTRRPRWVRIRVTDTDSDHTRVNLTLPIGVVRAGLRAGGSIAGIEGLDTTDLEGLLNRGEPGHLIDVFDEDDGERVEIFVE